MRSSKLDRKLVASVLALFLIPTLLVGALLIALYRRGVYEDSPSAITLTLAIGFVAMMAYLGAVTYVMGRALVRTLQAIQLGTELMATVNPDHRLQIRTGDELQSLAEEINRMADRVRDARSGLEREVARATRELDVERGKLSAVLEALGEGVVVATPDGRVTLANRAAQERLGAGGTGVLARSLFDFVDREKVAHFLDRLRAREDAAERFTLHPAGGAVLETVMTPFFDGERRMIGFILVLRDVTRPARSDDERRRLLTGTLRELRGPLSSIRSLSESLLADAALAREPGRRLLGAIHAEALRLSGLVREMDESARLGLARPPWHFEEIAVADLAAMALRRLGQEGRGADRVEVEEPRQPLPPLRAEASALSGAMAHLLRAVLARRQPTGPAWLRPARRGRLLQVEVGAPGPGAVADLEALLDTPVAIGVAGRLAVREIVRQHAGEVWAYAADGRFGFRLTLPGTEPREAAPADGETGAGAAVSFVGAGMVSGLGEGEQESERPDLYDFSLFDEMERHVVPADREHPLDELIYVVFDLEATGLHPEEGDRVLSIAGVKVRRGAVKRGESFDALVNPGRPIPAASVRFHGITDAMVAEAPPIDVVLPAFLRFAEGTVLVGHQVSFDLRFLAIAAEQLGLPPVTLAHPVLDTLLLSQAVHGPLPAYGLDAVAGRFGVVVRGRHSALGDALATAEVFVRLVELLKKRGVRTLGQAIDVARRARVTGAPVSGSPPPGI